ncbi:unnamed protein product, partial [marine sediment metagenome]
YQNYKSKFKYLKTQTYPSLLLPFDFGFLMQVAGSIAEIRRLVGVAKKAGQTVGFVATLGALHGGHMSLIER